jgi:FtsP/CotA-like multicopper oxidase with cupredoxin domain
LTVASEGPQPSSSRGLAIAGFLIILVCAVLAALLAVILFADSGGGAKAQTVREYNLEIMPGTIDYGGGNVWNAWTYNGTVPGPTLEGTVGDKLVINVKNSLDHVHSVHTHLSNYPIESDGSQINTISGIGAGAMIPPGGTYTYEFDLTEAGLYYYHDHSGEGTGTISGNIHQGLYGAILVHKPDEPDLRDEVIFMSEIGSETEGDNIPVYIMNGMGIPGGERQLELIFAEQGIDGVVAQLNKTVPAINGETGETIRVHVINIGDQIHSFHAHSVAHVSLGTLNGGRWAANTLPLLPGQADTLQFNFTDPGLWLFHCHVVAHADAGMIGLFNVSEAPAEEEQ